MVRVSLVDETVQTADGVQQEKVEIIENDDQYSDTESEVSEDEDYDDDDDLESETLLERISAFKDIVPPQYRTQLSKFAASTYSALSSGFSLGGKGLWILTTSSLLLGVPLSLSIISEQQLVEMEREMKMSQSTNEVLAPGAEQGFQQLPQAVV